MQDRHLLVEGQIAGRVPADAALAVDEHPVQKLRQTGEGVGPHDKIDIGVAHFQLFADLLLLGHAARQRNNELRFILFQAFERPDVAEHPLFGVFPDGAGIVEDKIRPADLLGKAVAQLR